MSCKTRRFQSIGDFCFRFGGKTTFDGVAFTRMFRWRMRGRKEEARKLVAAGIDPREHKRAVKEVQAKELLL